MNKIYRIIWNCGLGQWVVTSELGKSSSKGRSSIRATPIVQLALPLLALIGANFAHADPKHGDCSAQNICTVVAVSNLVRGVDQAVISSVEGKTVSSINALTVDAGNKYGGWVEGSSSKLVVNHGINLITTDSVGAMVRDGGTLLLSNDQLVFSAHNINTQTGFIVEGAGSTITWHDALDPTKQFNYNVNGNNYKFMQLGGGADIQIGNNVQVNLVNKAVGFDLINSKLTTNAAVTVGHDAAADYFPVIGFNVSDNANMINEGKIILNNDSYQSIGFNVIGKDSYVLNKGDITSGYRFGTAVKIIGASTGQTVFEQQGKIIVKGRPDGGIFNVQGENAALILRDSAEYYINSDDNDANGVTLINASNDAALLIDPKINYNTNKSEFSLVKLENYQKPFNAKQSMQAQVLPLGTPNSPLVAKLYGAKILEVNKTAYEIPVKIIADIAPSTHTDQFFNNNAITLGTNGRVLLKSGSAINVSLGAKFGYSYGIENFGGFLDTEQGAVITLHGGDGDRSTGIYARSNGVVNYKGTIKRNASGVDRATGIDMATGIGAHSGTIQLTEGTENLGLSLAQGVHFTNTGLINIKGQGVIATGDGTLLENGGTIEAQGNSSFSAVRLSNKAVLDLSKMNVSSALRAREDAHGIDIKDDSIGLNLTNGIIDVSASSGTGIKNNAQAVSGYANLALNNTTITVGSGMGIDTNKNIATANNSTINVGGVSGIGVNYNTQDSKGTTAFNGDVVSTGSAGLTINVQVDQGVGIRAHMAADKTITSDATINVRHEQGKALVVTGGAALIQEGVITSTSTTVAAIEAMDVASITNTGVINMGSKDQNAVLMNQTKGVAFSNNGGRIKGSLNFGEGDNSYTALNSASITGNLVFGSGTNTVQVNNAAIEGLTNTGGALDVVMENGATFEYAQAQGNNAHLTLKKAQHEIANTSVSGFSTINLIDNARLTTHETLDLGVRSGLLAIDQTSELAINKFMGDYVLDHKVSGAGKISVALTGKDDRFMFDSALALSDFSFSGQLELQRGTIAIDKTNSGYLAQSRLALKDNGIGIVNLNTAPDFTLNHLSLLGGTLSIDAKNIGEHALKTHSLTVEGGRIQINSPLSGIGNVPQDGNFFDQLSISNQALVTTQKLDSAAGVQLVLVDENGSVISSGATTPKDIIEHNITVGKAYYGGTGVTTTKNNNDAGGGIYLSYGLTKLESLSTIGLSNVGSKNNTLGTLLTGVGGFTLTGEPNTPMIIGHSLSDYTGATNIAAGAVKLLTNNAFGNTSKLSLQDAATLDLSGKNQTINGDVALLGSSVLNTQGGMLTINNDLILKDSSGIQLGVTTATSGGVRVAGALDAANGSTIDFQGASLTLNKGGVMAGTLKGSTGTLNVAGGHLTITQANGAFGANTKIGNGAAVTLGALNALGTGVITNEGVLNISGDGLFGNVLTSTGTSGTLAITGAPNGLTLTGNNNAYKGSIDLAADSVLITTAEDQLGRGALALKGTLNVTEDFSGTLANNLSATGQINLKDQAEAIFTGDNSAFNGQISIEANAKLTAVNKGIAPADVVNEGGLTFDVSQNMDLRYNNTLTGTNPNARFIKAGTGTLYITKDQTNYAGGTQINAGRLYLEGVTFKSKAIVINQGALAASGISVIDGALQQNSGGLYIGSQAGGALSGFGSLTITGDYSNNGGVVYLGGRLLGNDTQTDRLLVTGTATGHSVVVLENIGGSGGVIVNDIPVVMVGAGSTMTFEHLGRTVAGAYEYDLVKKSDGGLYLTAQPGNGVNPNFPWWPLFPLNASGSNNILAQSPRYRPETGSYLANVVAANTLFSHQLSERNYHETAPTIWSRITGDYQRFTSSGGQKTTVKNYALQIGGDLITQQLSGEGVFKAGVMFGYGRSRSTTKGEGGGRYRSKGESDGYALGLYATLAASQGFYMDSWIQYVDLENKVKGDDLTAEQYDAKGFIASIEGGYKVQLSDHLYLTPQAQLTWHGVKGDTHMERSGTQVKSSKNNIQTRIGAKFGAQYKLANIDFSPYAEINYIHNSKPYHVYFDQTKISQQGAKNIGQLQLGTNIGMSENVTLWGDVSYSIGTKKYRDAKLSIGVRYIF